MILFSVKTNYNKLILLKSLVCLRRRCSKFDLLLPLTSPLCQHEQQLSYKKKARKKDEISFFFGCWGMWGGMEWMKVEDSWWFMNAMPSPHLISSLALSLCSSLTQLVYYNTSRIQLVLTSSLLFFAAACVFTLNGRRRHAIFVVQKVTLCITHVYLYLNNVVNITHKASNRAFIWNHKKTPSCAKDEKNEAMKDHLHRRTTGGFVPTPQHTLSAGKRREKKINLKFSARHIHSFGMYRQNSGLGWGCCCWASKCVMLLSHSSTSPVVWLTLCVFHHHFVLCCFGFFFSLHLSSGRPGPPSCQWQTWNFKILTSNRIFSNLFLHSLTTRSGSWTFASEQIPASEREGKFPSRKVNILRLVVEWFSVAHEIARGLWHKQETYIERAWGGMRILINVDSRVLSREEREKVPHKCFVHINWTNDNGDDSTACKFLWCEKLFHSRWQGWQTQQAAKLSTPKTNERERRRTISL